MPKHRKKKDRPLLWVACLVALIVIYLGTTLAQTPLLPLSVTPLQEEDPPHITLYDHRADRLLSLPAEEYILGSLAAEMPASFHPQALRAQAVACRTWLVKRRLSGGCSGGDVCSDYTHCQAWHSESDMREKWGSDYGKYVSLLQEAVNDTCGLIMTYEGEPITAYYHSSSNGYTEDVREVFGSTEPYLVSVSSPDESASPSYTTVQHYTFAQVISLVRESCGITLTDPRREISILSRSASGRVSRLQLGSLQITGVKARSMFSLGSANFEITFSEDRVTFTATGHGHGVGMSQYGANAMASSGADYASILTHYYTGVQLSSAW